MSIREGAQKTLERAEKFLNSPGGTDANTLHGHTSRLREILKFEDANESTLRWLNNQVRLELHSRETERNRQLKQASKFAR